MKASETTLRNLLQGERQYVVPLYQRPYSWDHKDLDQLWRDLLGVVGGGGQATHFLGSVVLAPSPGNTPAGVQVWLVVDGQQRLTTLSILLCAIRDHVAAEDARLAEKINDLYLFNRFADGQERYTLLPTQADRPSWIKLLERAPDAGGQDRIGDAYRYFRGQLAAVDDPDDPHDIAHIEQVVAGQLSIVEIAAHADDNVHRIFESLNHTGQPLTQADLLRNYLFMRLPTRADHVYEHQWLPLQKLLTNKQLEELVWLDLVLRGDDRATQDAVYQSQQHYLKDLTTEDEIEAWITQLHLKARLFSRILSPATESHPPLGRALDRLSRWGAQVVHPISLLVMMAHDAGDLDDGQAARALRVVESFLVRRMIVGVATTNSNRILMTLVKDLGDAVPDAEQITAALSGARKKFPTDQHVRDSILVNNFYWTGRGPQRTFVLRCLEEDYRHNEPIDFARARLTIEHVLPQSLTQEWRDMLADGLTDSDSVEELHASLVHTLGNLSLTAYNAKLSNDGFAAKKKILTDSGLAMNRDIADSPRWGAAEIRGRARALADRAVRIWPGPTDVADTAPVEPQWWRLNQILACIPAGRWTSYSDVAEVIGTHQVAVGARLATVVTPNAHRVLKLSGEVSPEFRWVDPDRTEDPHAVLRAEGVLFDARGRASAQQRLTAAELASLAELDVDTAEATAASQF
ncbi:MAG TPA: DUF262 domain-containing protein [Pseudonocardiaceae bacterium]|nr:DUF262 domain-containing protein [Pseudonocardiaceae bacterium]